MFDPSTLMTHVEAVAHLAQKAAMQLASLKGGDVGGFDRLNQDFQQMGIDRL